MLSLRLSDLLRRRRDSARHVKAGKGVWVVAILIAPCWAQTPPMPSATADTTHVELVGHWVGSLTRKGRIFPLSVDIALREHQLYALLDLPEYCLYGCPTDLRIQDDRLQIGAKLVEARLTGRIAEEAFVGDARMFGKWDATFKLNRAEREPRVYVHEELTFHSSDAILAATLIKPTGTGPFPIIVWTHGSGPDTRKTFYYHGRAHLMAQQGVASLIYDKRGAGASTGDEFWKVSKLTEDALAAVKAIKDRPDVNASHIGIAGFSQGGWVAPAVAAASGDVDFVLVGATPGITGGEQNIFTIRNRLAENGLGPSVVETAATLMRQLYEFYETGEDRDKLAASLDAAREEEWFKNASFQSMMFMPGGSLPVGRHPYWTPFSPDPMEPWRKLSVPVFSAWGERDRNVPAALSKERIEAALQTAGISDHELVIFPSASHGLWVVRPEEAPWDWPRQASGYHESMVRWVVSHIAKGE